MKNKLLSLLFAIILITSATPVAFPANAAATVVFVSSGTGRDANTGLSASAPFATMKKAYDTLGTDGGTIVVMDSVAWTYTELPAHTGMITITGKDPLSGTVYPNAALDRTGIRDSRIVGPTTFEYLKDTPKESFGAIAANGNELIIGRSFPPVSTVTTQIIAAKGKTAVSKAKVSISSGTLTDFELNSYQNCTISGDVDIVLNEGITSIGKILLGSDTGSLTVGGVVGLTVNGDVKNQTVTIGAVSNYTTTYSTVLNKGYQIIFNNAPGASKVTEINTATRPLTVKGNKYVIYCSGQGYVSHAYDENGNIKPGYINITVTGTNLRPRLDGIGVNSGEVAITPGTHYVTFTDSRTNSVVYISNGGSMVAPITGIAPGTVYPTADAVKAVTSKDGYLFAGWFYNQELTVPVPSSLTVNDDIILYAKFVEISDNDFDIYGARIRTIGDQGFRFITKTNNIALKNSLIAVNPQNTAIFQNENLSVGMLFINYYYLRNQELKKDTQYYYIQKNYTPLDLETSVYSTDENETTYISDYTGITPEDYGTFYSVRPYFGYYTQNGVYNIHYGATYKARIYSFAKDAYEGSVETESVKLSFKKDILDVTTELANTSPVVMDATSEYLASLDAKAAQYKSNVVNSESEYTVGAGGTVYYVSADGNDSNDGKSPETAWKTLTKVGSYSFKAGDVVLFRRGDMWRGNISSKRGVTYSAYGTGPKPIINGSARNYADSSLWTLTGKANVYVYNGSIENAGILAFNHSGEIGKYDELTGTMKVAGVGGFTNYTNLANDLEFYSDLSEKKLYLYSTGGNPGERFSSIEIGTKTNIISSGAGSVTIDNLNLKFGGAHGAGSGTTSNLTVRNSIFCWIGGSILSGTTRYGNAVEIYGGCDGYYVYNNWMYQIYDTGVTHQFTGNSPGTCTMNDVVYLDNLIEYCFWSIEFYNGTYPDAERSVKNVYMKGNFCRFGGYGWGCKGRETGAPMLSGGSMTPNVENCLAEENIFDRCLGRLIYLANNEGNHKFVIRNNTYIQPYNATLGSIFGITYPFDENVLTNLQTLVGEENPTIVYIRS